MSLIAGELNSRTASEREGEDTEEEKIFKKIGNSLKIEN